jgi:predicted  nucleic acid-binding Zn-ribbon protein
MPNWVTEGIILALITWAGGAIAGGCKLWGDMRRMKTDYQAQIRKLDQEQTATNVAARLEFERLTLQRIDQLTDHLNLNETELAELRKEVATLREENVGLRARVRDLEKENAELRAELARICGERQKQQGKAE